MPELALSAVARTAAAVAATSSRTGKTDLLAALVGQAAPAEAPIVVGLLTGEIRQGRIGVGWATIRDIDVEPAVEPSLTVVEVDGVMDALATTTGPGSQARRRDLLRGVLGRATEPEATLLGSVLTGGLRQGALDGVMAAGVAKAAGVPAALVRRAAMLSGDLGETARIAMEQGRRGLEAVGLRVGRAIQPMLASTSESVAAAFAELGEVSIQAKLDGIRIQAHRDGDDVWLYTRNLHDVTTRLPDVVALVRGLPADSLVLDGEVIGISEDSPEMFQDTASTFGSGSAGGRVELRTQFFDILHRDGRDLIDEPLGDRLDELAEVAGVHMIEGIVSSDRDAGEEFADRVLAAGHEGVVVKAIGSSYAAGRRGKSWRKVKPVHTYDLVVLGAEWGHGRRMGWLSNLHLGARDGDDYVMVGKTFKGLTDRLLTWQTEALLELERRREGITVFVEPELVVEIAIDGVQRSTTYDGGLALRFARVKRYRPDKTPDEASTLDDLRALIR